jgi:hypothetical protein
VRPYSPRAIDWTGSRPSPRGAALLKAKSFTIDGEAVVIGPDGLNDFMHARFKRQVERKMAPGDGLFSLRLPKFKSYQPRILNSPAAMLFTLAPAG